jgi:hypothetical protein
MIVVDAIARRKQNFATECKGRVFDPIPILGFRVAKGDRPSKRHKSALAKLFRAILPSPLKTLDLLHECCFEGVNRCAAPPRNDSRRESLLLDC